MEEKLYDKISDYFDWCQKSKDCAKEVLEITEQECIGFAEWVLNKGYMQVHYHNLSRHNVDYKKTTSKQLFQLYQKSKENE